MRIDNTSGDTVIDKSRSGGIENLEFSSGTNAASRWNSRGADLVNLSGAASLLSVAKRIPVGDRQAKLDALAAQLRAGEYRPDTPDLSRAVVKDHLQQ